MRAEIRNNNAPPRDYISHYTRIVVIGTRISTPLKPTKLYENHAIGDKKNPNRTEIFFSKKSR